MSVILRKIFFNRYIRKIALEVFLPLSGLKWTNLWSVSVASEMLNLFSSVKHNNKKIYYSTINFLTKWRVDSFFEKEPETIEWIDSFKEGDTFFDVGANVGMYSIFAGHKGCKVFSFEPESSNYFLLNKNIGLNKLDQLVSSYCIAISDEVSYSSFFLSTNDPGAALHSVGEAKGQFGEDFSHKRRQGTFSMSLDEIIYKYDLPVPRYLKIDIDGFEFKVISGAKRLLQDVNLQGILVELNEELESDRQIVTILESNGFKIEKIGITAGCSDDYPIKNHIFKRI